MTKKKASEDMFNELHNIVTQELLNRIKSGEASTQDLKAACDWLAKNDISGVAYDGNPLDKLASIMPKVDPELVQTRLYGSKKVY
jgi:TPR repeat protein